MLLIPGIGGSGALFHRQIARLSRSYRVATYTLRDRAETMDVLIADVSRVLDALGATEKPAIIVGESFGGAIALSFALEQPGSVERLVLVNSFARIPSPCRLVFATAAVRAMPWRAMHLVRRATAARLHSPGTSREDIRVFLQTMSTATRAGYLSRLRMLRTYDVRHRLAEIRAPTLFVAAEDDVVVPSVAQAREMTSRISGSVVRVLADHRHSCLLSPGVDLETILAEWITPFGGTGR